MIRPFSIALLLLGCAPCLGTTIEEIAESALPSVVRIVAYDITGARIGEGSGFFISPGRIITNEHVVDGAHSAEVFTDQERFDLITVLRMDHDMDLAILSVNAGNETPLQMSRDAELRPGQRVVAIGNPLGLEKTLSDGLISAVRMVDHIQFLQITAPISPGSSGGPLLDQDGRVIGVVSATMREGQNLNFAIGIQTLTDFLALDEQPQQLKVAGDRVLWRAIVKWIMVVVASLIGLAFGDGWWLIAIAIMILVLLWQLMSWICRWIYRVVTLTFRSRHSRSEAGQQSRHSAEGFSAPMRNANPSWDGDAADDDGDTRMLHCWKCGSANHVDAHTGEEIVCSECMTTLPVPEEIRTIK